MFDISNSSSGTVYWILIFVVLFCIVSMLTVIVGVSAGGVALLLCLLLSCVVACWCYRNKKGRFYSGVACEVSAHVMFNKRAKVFIGGINNCQIWHTFRITNIHSCTTKLRESDNLGNGTVY